jgi:hypothetical protein
MGRYVVQGRKVTTDVVDFIIEVEAEDEEQACSFVENGDYEDDIDMQVQTSQ